MKKLIFLLMILAGTLALQAQTSTIVDNGPYITIQHQNGDTVCVGKANVVQVIDHNGEVYLMTSRKWSPGKLTKIVSLKASDYGYSSTGSLRDFLATLCFEAYAVQYSYDGSGNIDTIKYLHGSTIQHQVAFGYTGGNLTSKSIVTQ